MKTARDWMEAVACAVASPSVASPGSLSLAEFQASAARRLAAMVREWGGALLADAVGLGKTRVALAVAATLARERRIAGARGDVWCCVPARLAGAWRAAADAAGLDVVVVTHAAMSRGRLPAGKPLVVIVDEAHRFRNLGTRRREALVEVAEAALVLLTATPVANTADDLFNLLRLFVDDDDVRRSFGWGLDTAYRLVREGEWDATELIGAVTVRRTAPPAETEFRSRPAARLEVLPYEPSVPERWVWANLERAVRDLALVDEGVDWPGGLLVEHVLRRWESGPEALGDTLRDLEAFVARRISAAQAGRALDRSTFRELFGGDRAQEVFAFLYPEARAEPPSPAMLEDLERLRELRARVAMVCEGAFGRDEVIGQLAAEPEPLLVFTSYQRAAESLFARLCAELGSRARVGLVTGGRAEATGLGRAPAEEVLARFAPVAHGLVLEPHQQIQVLVATDCISEGVNLQDCGRVVLADLPYSPLGVEQRVGRLLRPGSRHREVRIYLPRPVNWNDSLGMRRRLSEKFGTARALGFGRREVDVFATLTELERIAAQSAERSLGEPPPAVAIVDDPHRWLVFARVAGRPWVFRLGDAGTVPEAIAELIWSDAPVRECGVPPAVAEAVRTRGALLRGAWEAPAALTLDDVQARAWRILLESRDVLPADGAELEELRERLLRPHRAGTRRQLDLLLADRSPQKLAAYVRSLPAPAAPPEVELVTVLGF